MAHVNLPFYVRAVALSVLLDKREYEEQRAYLAGLWDRTEVFREQAAWCWLLKFQHKVRV